MILFDENYGSFITYPLYLRTEGCWDIYLLENGHEWYVSNDVDFDSPWVAEVIMNDDVDESEQDI